MHVTLQHQAKVEDKSSAREGYDSSNTENNSKAVYKAVKCSVSYKKNQSFDSFEREIKSWIEATKGIPEYAKNLMFIEMLASTENKEVKRFYSTNIMNQEDIPKTIDSMMEKLKDIFGKCDRHKWDDVFKEIRDFKWNDNDPK